MEFAVCYWTPDFSPTGVKLLETEGASAVEPGSPFVLDRDEVTVQAESDRLRKAGIPIYSCHAPFNGEYDLSSLDDKTRSKALDAHVRTLRLASIVGARCIVVHPSGSIQRDEREERSRQLHRSLEALIRAAEDAGVSLALENMLPEHLGCEPGMIREVIDEFNSEYLGICFDVGHAHLNPGGVIEAFRAFRDRIITFHLQDNDGNSDRHLQPPYGTIDWEAFAPELIALNFPNPVAVEAPPWRGASWSTLLSEMRSLFEVGRLETTVGKTKAHVVCRACGRYCFGSSESWTCGCETT